MRITLGIIITACLLVGVALAQVNITPIADVSVTSAATLVKDQNAFRWALSCTNTHATVHVRWGSSTVTATTGQQLKAGAAIEIRSTGPVYMISEGATVTMSCTEETR